MLLKRVFAGEETTLFTELVHSAIAIERKEE